MHRRLQIQTRGRGLYEITQPVRAAVAESGVSSGMCHVFIQHTSASLLIQENADPSVQRDLEAWLDRLVAEGDPIYTHTAEGPDDMPAHVKAALTQTTLSVPVIDGVPALGRWQGIYLWEHRRAAHARSCIVSVAGWSDAPT
jgi:secondary thiamine-phosphate synthase enzyme